MIIIHNAYILFLRFVDCGNCSYVTANEKLCVQTYLTNTAGFVLPACPDVDFIALFQGNVSVMLKLVVSWLWTPLNQDTLWVRELVSE